MTTAALTPTQRAFLNINRNALVYSIIFFHTVPQIADLLTGRTVLSATDTSGNAGWQAIELFIFVNSVILMRFFGISSRLILSCLLPLAGMLVWILLSMIWSEYPWLTMRRGFRLAIEVTSLVILAASIPSGREVLRILFRAFFLINLADLISIAFPTFSFSPIGFAGVHGNKNLAGAFFFMALPIFFIGMFDRSVSYLRAASIFAFLSAAGMLAVSAAKTAIGVTIIATLFIVASRLAMPKQLRMLYIILFGLLALAILLVLFDIGVSGILYYFFDDPTLTGRDLIWRYTLQAFERSPLYGVGYGALWQVGREAEAGQIDSGITWFVINEAHNGYIDILAQLGIVGIVFLIFFVVVNFGRIYRYAYYVEQDNSLGLGDYAIYNMWGALVLNITDTYFFTPHPLWLILVFISAAVATHVLRIKLNRPVARYIRATS